ncbi:MAG: heparan-alpha-glucosaminide N-acetyltransferase domain-containing protein [Planctomycetota bacterium]
MPTTPERLPAVDRLRGLVMVLMAMDHVDFATNPHHAQSDSVLFGGGRTPAAPDFFVRWCTHLCAPTFVLLAGAAVALSSATTRHLLLRALVIIGLEVTLVSFYWRSGEGMAPTLLPVFLQVLWAIGGCMALLAVLRRLPEAAQLALAAVLLVVAELARTATLAAPWNLPLATVALLTGGPWGGSGDEGDSAVVCIYPLVPWLPVMLGGHVLGRHLRDGTLPARRLVWLGLAALLLFALVRGIDGFGNMGLFRHGPGVIEWLHCSKYPPSVSFLAMELGLALLLLAALQAAGPRLAVLSRFDPLPLFGRVPMFFYLLHLPMIALLQLVRALPPRGGGGAAQSPSYALVVSAACMPPCALYAWYRRRHRHAWTRFL